MILGMFILFAFLILGEAISYLLQLPVHGAAIGMLMITLWLMIRGSVSDELATASQQLISSLVLFVVPGVVGVFFLGEQFKGEWLSLGLALGVGTLLSVLTSLLLVKFGRLDQSQDD